MDKLLALLVGGAVSGAVYSLLAIGLTLTYSVSRVFNFAQGAVAFVATLLYYELTQGLHWPVVPALAVAVLVVTLLGVGVNEVVFRRLTDASDATKIVATVGLSIAIPAIGLYVVETAVDTFGADIPRGDNIFLPPGLGPSPKNVWEIGPATIDSNQVIALAVAVVVSLALWVLVRFTRTGLRMRATVDRGGLAESRGVDTVAVSRLAYALSFGIAGIAGITGAPFLSLTPAAYTGIMVVAAAAAVFAGLRSLPLALLGGILLGLAQSLFAGYVHVLEDIHGFASSLPYFLLFGGLFFLVRDRRRAAGQVAEVVVTEPLSPAPPWRRALPWLVGGVAFVVAVATVSDYQAGLLTRAMALALIFLSFTVVTGLGGMVSLSQASFALLAAVTMGWLIDGGLTLFPAALLALIATAVVGALFALPALRLGGLALALSTLALALIGDTVLFAYQPFTNGTYGWSIPRPTVGPFDLGEDRPLAVFLLLVVLLVVAMTGALRRSPSGRAILAVRSSEVAAASVGLSMTRSKLRVFTLSAVVAGLGGIMLAVVNGSATTASMPAEVGLTWLAIVVLIGIRRPAGAVIGALVFVLSPEVIGTFTDSTRIQAILFGLGAVQLAKSPDGILTVLPDLRGLVDRRRRPRAAAPPVEVPVVVAPADDGSRLSVRGLRAGYGKVEVVHGVDLDVPAGSITVLLGAGGAGKSTLCSAIAGSLATTSGCISLDAADLTGTAAHRRSRRGLAVAPEARGIFPGLTVTENLAVALPSAEDREKAFARFPALANRRDLEAGHLSGGEQQMLALAPLLVHPPQVLVADEPTLGLAPLVVAEVDQVLRELRDAGTAVLLAEEKASRGLPLADHVVLLSLGRLAWSGPAADADVDRLTDSYLEARR
jgi:ABC-type branched-subunit amino acid transport system ATPase component/branched-subunit amino acid ABC-type transport system permease component